MESSNYPCSIVIISLGIEINKKDLELFNGNLNELAKEFGIEAKNVSKRKNTYYVDFNYIYQKQNLSLEAITRPIKKNLFKEITSQILDYMSINDLSPIDYKNLKIKTLHNYVDFKRRKQNEHYVIPQYIQDEHKNLLENIEQIGFHSTDIYKCMKTIPTFEQHYVMNLLNHYKIMLKKEFLIMNKKEKIMNREYILFNGKPILDERKIVQNILPNEDLTNNPSNKISNIQESALFSDKICNVCQDNKINIVFQDCKHRFICEYCLTEEFKICPICKERIKKFVRVYNV